VTQFLVFRCANGVNLWLKQQINRTTVEWVNTRDNFAVPANPDTAHAESTLQALATHSISLAGAIQQVAQLDI
jgi:hypothetical protein